MNLDIVLGSKNDAGSIFCMTGYEYGRVRVDATDPPGECFTVVVTATPGASMLERVIWFYLAIVNVLDLGIVSRLLAWLWAIFGAVFGRISITQPTNKYENFVFERATYKYCWEVKELGVPDLLCIRTLLDRAIAGGAGSEVYEQLANVFKGVGIDDEMLPLCKYDFARLDLRSGDVKNWHVMAALVAVISFCGIKIRYCAGETLGRIDCIEMPAFSGGASEDSAAKFKQSRFCIDTTGNVYPNKVFPGYYTKICKYTFNEPGEKIYVYAGKGEYGHGIIFYTTKKAKQLDSHFNKSATGYYRVIGDFF